MKDMLKEGDQCVQLLEWKSCYKNFIHFKFDLRAFIESIFYSPFAEGSKYQSQYKVHNKWFYVAVFCHSEQICRDVEATNVDSFISIVVTQYYFSFLLPSDKRTYLLPTYIFSLLTQNTRLLVHDNKENENKLNVNDFNHTKRRKKNIYLINFEYINFR